MKYKLTTYSKKLLADTITPVNIYLKLRDVYAGRILLESSDYHGHENSLSFICCEPIASFQVKDDVAERRYPDGHFESETLNKQVRSLPCWKISRSSFDTDGLPSKYSNADCLVTCLMTPLILRRRNDLPDGK